MAHDRPELAGALSATFAMQVMVSAAMFGVPVLAPILGPALDVPTKWIGGFTALAYLCGAASGLGTGVLIRAQGAVRLLQITMLFNALGLFVLSSGWLVGGALSAVLLGLAYGPMNPATTDVLTRVSSRRRRALVMSLKQTGMPIGAAIAGLALPWFAAEWSWQSGLWVFAVMSLITAAASQPVRQRLDVLRFAPRSETAPSAATPSGQYQACASERDHVQEAPAEAGQTFRSALAVPLTLVWQSPALRRLAWIGFVYAGAQVALASFLVLFFVEDAALSLTSAGLMYTVMQLSAVAGRIGWGATAGHRLSGRAALVTVGLLSSISTVVLCHLPGLLSWGPGAGEVTTATAGLAALAIACALLGATSHGWNGVHLAEVSKSAPSGYVGEAAGGIQVACMLGVALAPALFGAVAALGGYITAFWLVALAQGGVALLAIRGR
ncbi:MAG: MFS transporter [Pseudomonadota bacterium]